jgi:release factor glutamine methyltransferase
MLGAFRDASRVGATALVANLPYVPSGELGSLQAEVRHGDPAEALDGGPDGLVLLRRLLHHGAGYVGPGGLLALETGDGQSGSVASMLRDRHDLWTDVIRSRDLAGRERVVSAVRTGGMAA